MLNTVEQYLNRLKPVYFGILLFLLLLAFNFRELHNPPYWDDIIGLHNQAIFIEKHNFSLKALWSDEPLQVEGVHNPLASNSNVYPYSVVPWIHALFYRVFSSPRTAHFAGHIFNILCLSIAGSLAYAIMLLGKSRLSALLFSLLAFLEPVLAARTAALGQECPLILGIMGALYFAAKNRLKTAIALCIAAFFLKPTAIALLFVLLFISFIKLVMKWKALSACRKTGIITALAALLLLGAFFIRRHLMLSMPDFGHKGLYILFPYLWLFTALATVLLAVRIFKKNAAEAWQGEYTFACASILLAIGMCAIFFFVDCPLPRYAAICTLPLFAVIGLNMPAKVENLPPIAFLTLLLLWHPYPPLPAHYQRSGEYLERSRDYLKDLKSNRELCTEISTGIKPEYAMVVKWPFGQMLTMPEFGYVDKPRERVYVLDTVIPKYAPVHQLLPNMPMPDKPIFLYTASSLNNQFPILPTKNSLFLYQDFIFPTSPTLLFIFPQEDNAEKQQTPEQ